MPRAVRIDRLIVDDEGDWAGRDGWSSGDVHANLARSRYSDADRSRGLRSGLMVHNGHGLQIRSDAEPRKRQPVHRFTAVSTGSSPGGGSYSIYKHPRSC
jgi:hypothetical protein